MSLIMFEMIHKMFELGLTIFVFLLLEFVGPNLFPETQDLTQDPNDFAKIKKSKLLTPIK